MNHLLEAICNYGERYRQEHLFLRYDRVKLLGDPVSSLDFVFGRIFYQGRNDKLSKRVQDAAWEVIFQKIRDPLWHFTESVEASLISDLQQVIGPGHVGKGGDITMILDLMRYRETVPERNIVAYSCDRIRKGELCQHYRELDALHQIGPKIAAFYLRDVVSLFDLEGSISPLDYELLQPIDVWVRKFAIHRMKIAVDKADNKTIARNIIEYCAKEGCSTLLFNQGVWYLSTHRLTCS